MELSEIIPHIEALIFASDRPLTSLDLVDLINNAFGFMEEQITLDQVETALEGIREKYSSDYYPFEVFQSGGGWQFLSKPSFHTTIAQLNGGKFLKKLSNAALETLAIIAYKQPITKGEIESIRGVNSDYSVQKLLEKELIIISGRNEELPGKPLIYETSKSFMDYFGLNSTTDLPKIKEVLAEQFEPTFQQRNIEENVDFGIFGKFNENKEGPDNTENNADITVRDYDNEPNGDGDGTTANNADSEAEPEPAEWELSEGENREAIQEATEDLEEALHPDLSSIATTLAHNHNEDTEEDVDVDSEEDSDAEEEELADLEAEDNLSENEGDDDTEGGSEGDSDDGDDEESEDEEDDDDDDDDEEGDDEDDDEDDDDDDEDDGDEGDEGDDNNEEGDDDDDDDDNNEDDDDVQKHPSH